MPLKVRANGKYLQLRTSKEFTAAFNTAIEQRVEGAEIWNERTVELRIHGVPEILPYDLNSGLGKLLNGHVGTGTSARQIVGSAALCE